MDNPQLPPGLLNDSSELFHNKFLTFKWLSSWLSILYIVVNTTFCKWFTNSKFIVSFEQFFLSGQLTFPVVILNYSVPDKCCSFHTKGLLSFCNHSPVWTIFIATWWTTWLNTDWLTGINMHTLKHTLFWMMNLVQN